MKKHHSFKAVLLGVILICPGSASAQSAAVIDDRGHTIVIRDSVKRVAAISYFAADTMLALGLHPVASTYLVKGRSPVFLQNCMDGLQTLGQRAIPNLELLAQARPDLIVAMKRYSEANAGKLEKIAPYMALNLENFTDSDHSILRLGQLLNQRKKAEQLNTNFHRDIQTLRELVAGQAATSYLFLWGSGDAPWAFYNENMVPAIINTIGGINVAGANPRPDTPDITAFEMSVEAMLSKNPEVIFIYDYEVKRRFENNPLWKKLRAVNNKRIIYVGDHWVDAHGPVARQAVLREATHALYPTIYPKQDVRNIAASMFSACH